ncbi:hypothetical protein [Saccharococcus thermophilus]|uniref:Uncharacterized protein n=1 Tax=Saccharococcus thermophilus TaxID=29396 RepID=A0A846MDP9_9BACL|nr:hypothetical protein [Saccharococcus thermophilus]NIK13889.1 hypothetical protein [Saccharococcus thermophilus]
MSSSRDFIMMPLVLLLLTMDALITCLPLFGMLMAIKHPQNEFSHAAPFSAQKPAEKNTNHTVLGETPHVLPGDRYVKPYTGRAVLYYILTAAYPTKNDEAGDDGQNNPYLDIAHPAFQLNSATAARLQHREIYRPFSALHRT